MKSRKIKYYLAAILLLCLSLVSLQAFAGSDTVDIDESEYYPVAYIIDGDTFKVRIDKKLITVRMLGINTPETVDPRREPECYGKEASIKTKDLLQGRQVFLHLEKQREVKDKFGRYLAYVYRNDSLFVNQSLIEGGFAREYTYGKPYFMQREFRSAEDGARRKGNGMWSVCDYKN